MLPRWHILFGVVFSALIWLIFPEIAWYNLTLIFFGAVFIDFDHYMCAVYKTGKLGLSDAFEYHEEMQRKEEMRKKKGIFIKENFHVFHTIEFHILVLALGLLYLPFLFIFIGMVFHSLLDLADLTYRKEMYRREFLLVNWLRRKCFL